MESSNNEGIKWYQGNKRLQMIVRATDAVQIYILTRCFGKTPIRIFPIALPLKQDNAIEQVFNGVIKRSI
jgi:hypothetical protein